MFGEAFLSTHALAVFHDTRPMGVSARKIAAVQHALAQWFSLHQRDLPWRKTRDSYKILVSEIMLQQTQVDRVIPKYRSFLRQFPTVRALARSSPRTVLLAWAGLGYNRRALQLLRLARRVAREFGGRIPTSVEGLRGLPGVGPYTAAAVATFSTGVPHALADTNVKRVVSRVFCGRDRIERMLPLVSQVMSRQTVAGMHPSLWGHAIMDLGALVCRARPRCAVCPLARWCRAYPRILEMRNTKRKTGNSSRSSSSVSRVPDRLYRGRILQLVRTHDPDPVALTVLRAAVAEVSSRNLHRLVRGMVADGLLAWVGPEVVHLPREDIHPRSQEGGLTGS